ncbi:MAG: AraC family transcriptional regulator [Synergistaceae bacterium]|jgi:AraC-like DNA-binding protein|nr:AraC family transcriptional regulator [Synergistaceae bacterium]
MNGEVAYYNIGNAEIIHMRNWTEAYPTHNHVSVCVIGIILGGEVSMTLGGGEIKLSPNGSFTIPPYKPHSLRPLAASDILSICLRKDAATASHSTPATAADVITKILLEAGTICADHRETLLRAADGMVWAQTEKPRGDADFVSQIRELFEQSPEADVKIRQAAKSAAVCQDHLIRKFKQEIGLTPRKFQIQNRIRMAQRLMEKNFSVSEVAQIAGFYDQSHFIKYFKYFVRMPPRDYVRAFKGAPPDKPVSTAAGKI